MSEYDKWCQNVFNVIVLDGVWGVPRSGLIFRKEEDGLVLVEASDADTRIERAYQASDYEDIKRHFEEAGINVRSEVEL